MTQLKRNTFSKEERLCSKKVIEDLFENGKSVFIHPLKLIYKITPTDKKSPVRVMMVVPKKNFRKAHDRNRIKRLMRESYRLQKHDFYDFCITYNRHFAIALVYVAKSEADFKEIFFKTGKLLKLVKETG